MKNINEGINISKRLFSYLKGDLSSEEKKEIEKILEKDEELLKWFNQFRKESYIYSRLNQYNQIDLERAWQKQISLRKHKPGYRFMNHWMTKVASVIVLLSAGWYAYHSYHTASRLDASDINPGSSKAELITENGTRYELKTNQPTTINSANTSITYDGDTVSYHTNKENRIKKAPIHTIYVPRGGEYMLVLEDGTKVWLNSQSRIKYPAWFGAKERRIELVGEAYFDVQKDSLRPFIVSNNEIAISVLGTQFNLRAYEDEDKTMTTLVEGSVKVSFVEHSGSLMLKPGEQALVHDNKIDKKTVNTEQYTAWKDGLFVFNNEPLEEMFHRMSRWYDFRVIFEDQDVKLYPFTGKIRKNEKIENILTLLERTRHVNFKIKNKTIWVLK